MFGRGKGESLVLHLGGGQWAVVDSFVHPTTKRPIALEYLDWLDVPRDAIQLVVATHWDDDHINGLARVLREAPGATFVCSAAVGSEQAVTWLYRHQQRTVGGPYSSGVKEFVRVLDELAERADLPVLAQQDLPLFQAGDVTVTALSPSQATLQQNWLAALESTRDEPEVGTSVRQVSPNNSSVVLWLAHGSWKMLLGADLECSSDPNRGWSAVLGSFSVTGGGAGVFKVPHHGSDDADDPRVWDTLLHEEPWSPLTAYTGLVRPRPRDADVERIIGYGARAAVAGRRGPRPRLHGMERRMVDAATRSGLHPVTAPVGHIRLRAKAEASDWTCNLFGNAEFLTKPSPSSPEA